MHYSNVCVCVCVLPSDSLHLWMRSSVSLLWCAACCMIMCRIRWSLGQESDPRWAVNNTFSFPRSWREREKERVRWSFITLVRMRMNPECISMATRVSFLPTLPLRLSPSIHTLLLSLILKCVFVQACVMLLPSSYSISSTMKSAERNTSGSSRGAWEC